MIDYLFTVLALSAAGFWGAAIMSMGWHVGRKLAVDWFRPIKIGVNLGDVNVRSAPE